MCVVHSDSFVGGDGPLSPRGLRHAWLASKPPLHPLHQLPLTTLHRAATTHFIEQLKRQTHTQVRPFSACSSSLEESTMTALVGGVEKGSLGATDFSPVLALSVLCVWRDVAGCEHIPIRQPSVMCGGVSLGVCGVSSCLCLACVPLAPPTRQHPPTAGHAGRHCPPPLAPQHL